VLAELDHHAVIAFTLINELHDVALTYEAAAPSYRRELTAQAKVALERAGNAIQPDASPRLAWTGTMILDGRWQEANELFDALPPIEHAFLRRNVNVPLGTLARHRGDPDRAWAQVWPVLPDGPATEPGDSIHQDGLSLQRLAAELCLDAGDPLEARAWLEAHDRWLAWSQCTLGAADGLLSWARYFQRSGQPEQAREAATTALDLATAPAQPLVCLATHRLLGELATRDGDLHQAEQHFTAALELATACETPFERALTLLALAEIHIAGSQPDDAITPLNEATLIIGQLGALPAMDRALQLQETLDTHKQSPREHALLTPRELDVLRLLAQHQTNREIAGALFISPRTVQSHVEHICIKLGVDNRRQAATKASTLGLI
jgi:DNA-binding CsgD family transcriptional regulator